MSGSNTHASDAMIRRHEVEAREKEIYAKGIIETAEREGRDMTEDEKNRVVECRDRIVECKEQMDLGESLVRAANEARQRGEEMDREISRARSHTVRGPVEYRSAGAYTLDMYNALHGSSGKVRRDAAERLQVFNRDSADGEHFTTADNEGIIPDPVIQPVIDFIDAGRPLVSALGARALPAFNWHRPRVTQHTAVAKQDGEKTELVNQRMKVERVPVSADTYGGFANVSRQIVDFSTPAGLDLVVQDLAAQYSIETEAATAAALAETDTAAVDFDSGVTASITGALWGAVAKVFAVTKTQGRVLLVVSPDAMMTFGPLFAPINPQNAQSTGFSAASFAQGIMGNISGIPTVMCAALSGSEAFVLSTAGVEVYEQRGGTLQVTEPSVLGVQVAYFGYFATLLLEPGAVVPLNDTSGS